MIESALVGKSGFPRFLRQNRRIQLRTEKRPGAATDIDPFTILGSGNGRNSGSSVVAADFTDVDLRDAELFRA